MKLISTVASCILIFSACAHAAEPAEGDEKIAEVAMSAGLDAFDEYRQLAPNANLKFNLIKHGDEPGKKPNWDGVRLRLAGNEISIPVPIEANGTFILPRSKEAYDDDADVLVNLKKSQVHFWLEVRTPGIPPNARRLGDIRLECKVIMAIARKELSFAQRALGNAAFRTTDWCSAPRASIGTQLPDWSINTTVSFGGQRKVLPSHRASFAAPIQDKSLPDDALIEFEFWGSATAERKQQFLAQWPLFVNTSMNKWGAGSKLIANEKGIYSAEMQLKPGSWQFNIESAGREVNVGALQKNIVLPFGADHAMQWQGSKLSFKVEQAGAYDFALNLQDPDHPVINLKRVESK
ncbi:MAG: hypothetical protein V4631_22490 [Pseudomonadota bacterium]